MSSGGSPCGGRHQFYGPYWVYVPRSTTCIVGRLVPQPCKEERRPACFPPPTLVSATFFHCFRTSPRFKITAPIHHRIPLSFSPVIYRMIIWRGGIRVHGTPPLPHLIASLPLPYICVSCPNFICTLPCRDAYR